MMSKITHDKTELRKAPTISVARLVLASYLRSGWMWGEFVLMLAFFGVFFFPYTETTTYFNGIAQFGLGTIAILGSAILVRRTSNARAYLLLARLTSRGVYSCGLMLAVALLRITLYLCFLVLVLLTQRLTDPTFGALFYGGIGVLANTILVSVLTVALSAPIATRLQRIAFLVWLVVVLFSFQSVLRIAAWAKAVASVVQIPLWPVRAVYGMSTSGNVSLVGMLGLLLVGVYCVLIALIAGYWLERRELLLY